MRNNSIEKSKIYGLGVIFHIEKSVFMFLSLQTFTPYIFPFKISDRLSKFADFAL